MAILMILYGIFLVYSEMRDLRRFRLNQIAGMNMAAPQINVAVPQINVAVPNKKYNPRNAKQE
jgi:hypothetical protein